VAKIVDRDDDVVFSSIDVNIETWERVWKSEKRSLSVTVEEYDCPYDSISCFADDLCVQCKMDKLKTVLGSLISNFVERQARPEFLMKLNRDMSTSWIVKLEST